MDKRILKGRDSWNNDIIYWEEISQEQYHEELKTTISMDDYSICFDQDTGKVQFLKRFYGSVDT